MCQLLSFKVIINVFFSNHITCIIEEYTEESWQYLFGQELFTERVECDKLPSEDPGVNKALSH